jgi:hypothetical protein
MLFFSCIYDDTPRFSPISLHILSAGTVSSHHRSSRLHKNGKHVGFYPLCFIYLLCETVKMQKKKAMTPVQ